jgi:hypothetical protein
MLDPILTMLITTRRASSPAPAINGETTGSEDFSVAAPGMNTSSGSLRAKTKSGELALTW